MSQVQQPVPPPPESNPAPTTSRAGMTDTSKFKLLAELGRGGMATVYLAVVRGPAGFNKLVVVKCLRPSLAAEPEFLEMFLAEARLAARINHPNVVQTNEVGFDGQFYFIVMEYIEGPTLESMVRKGGENLPAKIHLFVLMQALQGLHHAHELKDFDGKPLNVVHRDLSPHNIMVSYDGQVKLLDFGIAKAADSGGNTRTGIMKGKCAYMSAEQFGGKQVDRRADIFAAGVCLWQAVTHARLWKGLSDAEIFSRISRGEIPSPKSIKPDLPDALVKIIMRSLALRPEDRYATVADFVGELDDFIQTHPDYRASQRDLTKYVTELFAKERETMQAKIDDQLRTVQQLGEGLVAFQAEVAQGLPSVAGTSNLAGVQTKRSSGVLIAGLLALLAAGGGLLYMRKSNATTGTTAGPAQARVTVKATPESAKIFWDGAPLGGNPASAAFTRDGLSHNVRVEAPGYVRKTELVVLDSSNVSVEVALEPESTDEVDPFGNKLSNMTIESPAPNARLYWDGVLLPSNPSTAKYPRDGKEHEIKADAPGYIAKTQKVVLDKPSGKITIELARDPRATAPVVFGGTHPAPVRGGTKAIDRSVERAPDPPPPPPVTAATAPTPPPATTKPQGKQLDRNDPWAN
jgi:serine/threonine-protein kinase